MSTGRDKQQLFLNFRPEKEGSCGAYTHPNHPDSSPIRATTRIYSWELLLNEPKVKPNFPSEIRKMQGLVPDDEKYDRGTISQL